MADPTNNADKQTARYIIGIDLGTTNSVVAYTEAQVEKGKTPAIQVLAIPQLVDAGTVETRKMLPSFILSPGPHDLPEDALVLPWDANKNHAVGEYARERGAEIPHRLIASAKSWLCHPLVDRNKPILPWQGSADAPQMSPVEASAAILGHIREAWNHLMADGDPELALEKQEVLLTVPASFDAVARELTVKAAAMAGIPHVTLLEEPQAAFYAWIESTGEDWRKKVETGDRVLVCDVGGGTSDFSLISVSEEAGDLVLDRVAVGDHLLVGGDNMDLALAHFASEKLTAEKKGKKKKQPDAWQMRGLWHACRKAKEKILGDPETEEYPVTLLGRGKSLIGGTQKTRLTREEIESVLLNGFFPECPPDAAPSIQQRFGIQEVGLSYEADPAITHHLAGFLQKGENNGSLPSAILFNGGVMKSQTVRDRVMAVLGAWGEGEPPREIQSSDFDLTVARGAAYYGLARLGGGIRIRGGLNRSYYIGVAAAMPAVPGMPVPIKALCVAPFGMEEGTRATLEDKEFVLVVGESVKFDFLGSTSRMEDTVGLVVDDWEDEIEEITTIETVLDGEKGTVIPVYLEVRVTEVGTLEIWCVSRENPDQRWKLEFNVREKESLES